MNDFDQASGFATQVGPQIVLDRLFEYEKEDPIFREWFNTKGIARPETPKRSPDLVAIIDAMPDTSLMVFELQAQHDQEKLDITLLEVAIFRVYARHGEKKEGKFRVLAGMVYLKGDCSPCVLDMTTAFGSGTRHEVLVWEVAKDSAEMALDDVENKRVGWQMLFWIALMTGADDPDIIARWIRLMTLLVDDAKMRQDLVLVALNFAELAGWGLAWQDALKEWQMVESQIGRKLRAEGALQATRSILLRLMRSKYGNAVNDEVTSLVNRQDDLSTLETWLTEVLAHDEFADFIQTLR